MEEREGLTGSGVTVVGSDAPADHRVTPVTGENPSQVPPGSAQPVVPHMGVSSYPPSTAAGIEAPAMAVKKKRGRPRKYGPDGGAPGLPLSPKPISTAVPPSVIDFSAAAGEKRWKILPLGPIIKLHQPKLDFEHPSEWVSCALGSNFTPHIITVNAGEDVTMKIISFSQQGPRGICILSANGVISSVTLRQPDSSGGTLTYEGRFEILSLTGSFMPSETGGIRNRSGGMSVSLASPDGRVVGGGVAGMLVAAAPVQIVVGSFVAENQENQQHQKTKKHRQEPPFFPPAPASAPEAENHHNSLGNPAVLSAPSFRGDHWPNSHPDSRNMPTDINEPSLHKMGLMMDTA
ncbi:hypothetical protein DM860_011726 [Cuscuta australis]|uniref:AT-hook motif nuclear-localized protein n=1 Tax=Cuscuta australis TaxID=267555 RepID=A0A328DJF6_9ASTE|nr:hypothetical protein DM860_011726 [Cuscuta australis]